jgi:hypothetical protein
MIKNLLKIQSASRRTIFKILLLVILTSILSVVPASGQAQEVGEAKVSVSPALFELSTKPGDVLERTIKVINTSGINQAYEMGVQPFVGNELGQAKIVADDDSIYFLKNWTTISPQKFSLLPKQTQEVKFVITIPTDAEPGGQYASILATLTNNDAVSGTGAVTRSKVGTLVLVAVAGDINYSAFVKDFNVTKKRYEKSPITFNTDIHNNSTVHIKPKGFITLTDIFGRKAASIDFDQKNIFPKTDRLITQSYDQPLRIGRYVATLNVLYGDKDDQLSSVLVFYIFPIWLIILCIAIVTLFILFLIYRKRQKRKFAKLLKAVRTQRPMRRMG